MVRDPRLSDFHKQSAPSTIKGIKDSCDGRDEMTEHDDIV